MNIHQAVSTKAREKKVSVIANNSTTPIMNCFVRSVCASVSNLGGHFFVIFHYLFITYSPTITYSPRRVCIRGSEILHGLQCKKNIRISLNKYLGNYVNLRQKRGNFENFPLCAVLQQILLVTIWPVKHAQTGSKDPQLPEWLFCPPFGWLLLEGFKAMQMTANSW